MSNVTVAAAAAFFIRFVPLLIFLYFYVDIFIFFSVSDCQINGQNVKSSVLILDLDALTGSVRLHGYTQLLRRANQLFRLAFQVRQSIYISSKIPFLFLTHTHTQIFIQRKTCFLQVPPTFSACFRMKKYL